MAWFNAETFFPSEWEDVLCIISDGIDRRYKILYRVMGERWSEDYRVTHWMPLPAFPKDKE